MAEELKASRKARKGALTREINALDRFMAEDNVPEVESRFQKMKEKFAEFEKVHLEYHETLNAENLIDESDDYFYEVQKSYVDSLKSVKSWLSSQKEKKPEVNQEVKPQSSEALSREEFMRYMNLPGVTIPKFTGEPLQYHKFFAIFDEQIDRVIKDNRMKLNRLIEYTTGDALDAIENCAIDFGEDGYAEAREILKRRFGNEHVISDLIIRNLRYGDPVKDERDLQKLADNVSCCYVTLQKMKRLNEVDTQSSIVEIINRCQNYVMSRWRKIAFDCMREKNRYPDFREFRDFILREAQEANDPVYGCSGPGGHKPSYKSSGVTAQKSSDSSSQKPQKKMSSSFASGVDSSSWINPCLACGENHRLLFCKTFQTMKLPQRLQLVQTNKLCENCLLANHATKDCKKQSVCSVPGCGRHHTKYIHTSPRQNSPMTNQQSAGASNNQIELRNCNNNTDIDVLVPLVKITVNDSIETCALLDTGSTTSFCTQSLVDELCIDGTDVNYTLSTLSNFQQGRKGKLVNLDLISADGVNRVKLTNVYVVDCIPVTAKRLSFHRYPHLSDLQLDELPDRVDVLIGQDHADVLMPLKVRCGAEGEPFATCTILGWSVNGPIAPSQGVSKRVISHFVTTDQIENDFHKLWNIENENVARDKCAWSLEDKRVIELWDNHVQRVEGHYQLPIPFKDDVVIPNNLPVAMSRLKSLTVSLAKRGLTSQYSEEIRKLCNKSYAEKIPIDEIEKGEKVWYLPHQAVVSERKPGKLRIVYDCASKFHGQSLNDKCLQGPDLTNKLLYVLLRFRNHAYALTADIEAMYYQVMVNDADVDCLRFLWVNENGDVEHYRMLRHVFGGVWSGCAASYALRRTVDDFPLYDDIVKNVILNAFYVDDCLVSLQKFDQAKSVLHKARELLSHGGFNLTKFVANDSQLLAKLPESDRASEVKEFKSDSKSKVLGLVWNVMLDQFQFDVKLESPDVVTRRVMLSLVSSLYDPLGLISPVLIVGRILLQDVTRMKLDWDTVVSSDIQERWNNWLWSLLALKSVSVPRCVKPSQFDDGIHELHHFSDANGRAYGCVSYLRSINKSGEINVMLLCSKGRVAPLKAVSIPRLELQAAVMAARMDEMLREELHLELCQSHFWVDSEIVLNYISNDSRRFHIFVSNRVSEIRNLTSPEQWQHIAGSENPADVITRGQQPHELVTGSWVGGPQFLHSYKSDWKKSEFVPNLSPDDAELKRGEKQVVCHIAEASQHPIDVLVSHYSSWSRLKRALAWWLRLRSRLLHRKQNVSDGVLTVSEVKEAEVLLIQHVQSQVYKDEINNLLHGESKKSGLRDLSPFVNEKGMICVGGRVKFAELNEENKHPIILPHDNRIAQLIVHEYHNVAHLGVEWTLSWIRKKFWITRCRSLLKKVRRDCVICRKLFDPPGYQRMADLPPERLIAGKPPFSFIGIDCFGPFAVKLGRSEVKRYGCVFTCLNVRAVHIEKLDSLDTDSFLNCFRRFCARRGLSLKVWSDNGTNFVGAHNELIKCAKQIDQHKIRSKSTQMGVEWSFNPPCASHWGGIWERMIRTIRKVLAAVLNNTRLTDEILSTVLCEVECIINGRPITKVSSDPNDPTPLSPNHILLLRGGSPPPIGSFDHADTYRKRWRHVQYLSDLFWKRWIREYIPILQFRQKWYHKQRNLQIGDLVLVSDENTPRHLWPLGLITEVRVSGDGLVRAVSIKTQSTNLVRPISKVVLIEGV